MPREERITGSDITVLLKSPEPISSESAQLLSQASTVCESAKSAAPVGPTDSEIAALAYQLWADNGCPEGIDQENWTRAEATLKAAFAVAYESLSGRTSVPSGDIGAKYEILAEFRWEGHWETWESECGGARWVCDSEPRGVQSRIDQIGRAAAA
jgi:hypothetical protein